MSRLLVERRCVNSLDIGPLIEEAVGNVLQGVSRQINEYLVAAVEHLLGRLPYVRREQVASWIESGRCACCQSTRSRKFSRNGYRARHLLTPWGELHIDLPRVVCQCGGSVRLDFGPGLRPYQRLSNELDSQIQRWGALCLSLRQMQAELAHSFIGPLGLRTLLTRLHQVATMTPAAGQVSVPPILHIDAIWLTQLRPNGQLRRDRKGRKRAVKGRYKRPLLIALGLWPATGQVRVLAWQLAEDEDGPAWLAFLSGLEEQGIRGEQGLQVIIHDGGTGLCAALQEVYFGAAHQRCLFHKLRNIANALKLPEELSAKQRTRLKKAILKDFRHIWEAKRYPTALRRYLRVVRQYRASQPTAVATLRRDFRETLTYYHLQQQFPDWPREYLRTISHLERLNKTLRHRTRAAGAYHSDQGILAVIEQVAHSPFPNRYS